MHHIIRGHKVIFEGHVALPLSLAGHLCDISADMLFYLQVTRDEWNYSIGDIEKAIINPV